MLCLCLPQVPTARNSFIFRTCTLFQLDLLDFYWLYSRPRLQPLRATGAIYHYAAKNGKSKSYFKLVALFQHTILLLRTILSTINSFSFSIPRWREQKPLPMVKVGMFHPAFVCHFFTVFPYILVRLKYSRSRRQADASVGNYWWKNKSSLDYRQRLEKSVIFKTITIV